MKISELKTTNLLCADTKILVSNPLQNNSYATTLLKYNTLSNSINSNVTYDIENLKQINSYIDDIKNLNTLEDNITKLQQHLDTIATCINNIGLNTLGEGETIKSYIDNKAETKFNELTNLLINVRDQLNGFTSEITNEVVDLKLSVGNIALSANDILNSDLTGISNKINMLSANLYNGWESEYIDESGVITPGDNQLSLYLLHRKTSHIYNFMFGTDDTDDVDDNTTSIDQYLQQQIDTNIDIITDNIFQIEQFTAANQTINKDARKYINIKLSADKTFNAKYSPIYITSIDINPDTNIKVLCAYINQADNSVGISLINTNTSKNIACSITINVLYAKI